MVTVSDLISSLWLGLFLLAVAFTTFSLAKWGVLFSDAMTYPTARQRATIRAGVNAGFPLSFTGLVIGFLTGSSRSPAVSALVPAILTFIGLFLIYMIGKGRLRAFIAGFAVFAFTVNLVTGVVLGAASRDRHEEVLKSFEARRHEADVELSLRLHCVRIGLIKDVTKPCLPTSTDEKSSTETADAKAPESK
jgi:hypothetical protein